MAGSACSTRKYSIAVAVYTTQMMRVGEIALRYLIGRRSMPC
jgi:hypothetical protein